MSQTVESPADEVAAQHQHQHQHQHQQPANGSDTMGSVGDMSDEELGGASSTHDPASPGGSAKSSSSPSIKAEDGVNPNTDTPTMPIQKRRRVTRACDECRRKKIKCDGKQPCTHCSVYSYECTYDKPSNRRRNPAPQYIEALENRLQRAEVLLRKFMPDVDLNDPSLDPTVQQEFQNRERQRNQAARVKREQAQQKDDQGTQIRSMIETIGQLDLSEGGEWDFHGISSGHVFLRRMKEHFRGVLGPDCRSPLFGRQPRPPGMFNLDSPRSSGDSPSDELNTFYELPEEEHARKLCFYSLNCATCLLRIVHIPSFFETFDRLYSKPPNQFSPDDHRSLALVYSVMALGCMYNISEDGSADQVHYKTAMKEGFKYYTRARLLVQDITECRDLVSLQALLFMILFLQATSNLSACYAFIGIALRAALRMGLHRHLPHAKLTVIEHESRRRVFYVIRQMDTYVSALLGFPLLLRDDDIDQPLPTEVDDEYITKDAIITPPPGTSSYFEAFNAHTKLMGILAKVIKYIYPLKGIEECVMSGDRPNATYMISYARIKEIECELHEWYEQLPIRWRPSPEGPIELIRIRTLLRFAYAHVQMMLYRPFLHYISPRIVAGKNVDERYYACAAAGISISRNIVHIGMEIKKQAVLIGPYWFILYTQYFAILSLVFYALENPDKPGASEILNDALAGRDVIASLTQRSMAADRVTASLNTLFEELPDQVKTARPQPRPVLTKKRSAPPSKTGSVPIPVHPVSQARRSEDLDRSGREQLRQISQRISFDAAQRQQHSNRPGHHHQQQQQQQFMAKFPDLLPLDLSPATGSPDSSGTPSTSHRSAASFQAQHQASMNSASHLYKFDAMMFPSTDPFAYPNRPMMEFNLQQQQHQQQHQQQTSHGGGSGSGSGHQGQDDMQFYVSGVYDDIEGQLLGPIPPYLMQTSQAQGLDLSSQMYTASSLLTLQQAQARQAHQRQQRELEELLADPNFDVFPHSFQQL